ncbi:MAG: hypothetical protein ABR616_18955 [Dermatophilaceae bacterium]
MTVTHEAITLTVTGSDADEFAFSFDGGASWSDWQASNVYAVTGLAPQTGYPCRYKVRNDAGRVIVAQPTTVTTAAASDSMSPAWSATFTVGTPTSTQVQVTASSQATDDIGIDHYEVSHNDGATWATVAMQGGWIFNLTGEGGATYAQTKLRAVDAAGNASTQLDVPSYTLAPTRTLLADDDFDRADSTTGLGTSSGGQVWEQIGDLPMGVYDGHASPTTGSGLVNFAVVDVEQQDMVVEGITTAQGAWTIAGRVVDADNYFSLIATNGNNPRMSIYIDGSSTPLAPNVTVVSGDRVAIRLVEEAGGTRYIFSVNEVQKYSLLVTTAGRPTGTKAGLRFVKSSPAPYFDRFTVRDGA